MMIAKSARPTTIGSMFVDLRGITSVLRVVGAELAFVATAEVELEVGGFPVRKLGDATAGAPPIICAGPAARVV